MRRPGQNPLTGFLQAVVRRLALSDGSVLDVGAVSDGEFLKRSGSSIISALPDGGTGGAGESTYLMLPLDVVTTESTSGIGTINITKGFRFTLRTKIVVNRIAFRVGTTPDSGKFWSVGIYNSTGTTLLVDGGPQSLTSASTIRDAALGSPVTLTPGTYILAWTSDSSAAIVNSVALGTNFSLLLQSTAIELVQGSTATVAGQLPSSMGTLSSNAINSVPIVKLQ